MNSPLMIIDTGDNYILSLKTAGYEDALELYTLMDVTVNEIQTESTVSATTAKFVFESIGRVIAYGFADGSGSNPQLDIPARLISDIKVAVDFMKAKLFWENLQFPLKSKKLVEEVISAEGLAPFQQPLLNFDATLQRDTSQENVKKTYVLFNTIYNLALVVDNDVVKNIADLLDNFKEFVSIVLPREFEGLPEEVRAGFKRLFHKIAFESVEEVQSKVDAFKSLYNVGAQDSVNTGNNEKARVKQFLSWNFILSNDIDKRMKANDLYKAVMNQMLIPFHEASSFKKKLAGYLTEFPLQKKRYSDAYYYYGIEPRKMGIMSPEDIATKRLQEQKGWFNARHPDEASRNASMVMMTPGCNLKTAGSHMYCTTEVTTTSSCL